MNLKVIPITKPTPTMEQAKKEIMKMISPYLENIQGAYLTGSFARNEQTNTSDIDVLLITDEQIKIPSKSQYDLHAIQMKNIKKTIRGSPIQFFSMIKEAKPIINKSLLKELNNIKINHSYIIEHLESTKRILKILDSLLKKYKKDEISPCSIIYSIILRLRSLFLIESLLKNKKYSNSDLKKAIKNQGINKTKTEEIYKVYQIKRNTKRDKRVY